MKETTNNHLLRLNNVRVKVEKEYAKRIAVFFFAIKGWSILISMYHNSFKLQQGCCCGLGLKCSKFDQVIFGN